MSNPLITDDKAILSVLLYQFLRRKSAYLSFKEFNEVVKDNFIDLNDFKFWFKRFKNGKFDERDDYFWISDFKSMLSDDKHCLRACIFFEYLNEIQMKSEFHHGDVFAAYKKMNEVIDIDYPELDFCFYRFLRGEFDLNFEYNPAQIRSFSDLPLETIRRIVGKLNFPDRCRFRKVSYNLRNIVADTKIGINQIDIRVDYLEISVNIKTQPFEFVNLNYYPIGPTCVVEYNSRRKEFKRGNYLDFASNDLSLLLNKSEIDRLKITISVTESFIDFENISNSLHAKLHVKHISMTVFDAPQFVKTLSFLKPGTLEFIDVACRYDQTYNQEATMIKLLKMDQWRQAKILKWCVSGFPFPLECLSHFCTNREVKLRTVSSKQFQEIKDSLLKHEHIESWRFTWNFNQNVNENEMNNLFGPIEADGVRHLEIPNTNAYYQITVHWFGISITKKKLLNFQFS
ncbi:hypothetical protein B9Z55_021132 [Caenorhabditis nigoni]|uniref:F-box domain-containing protein n=1 Tax=Caenorhabditis nigoni TaxID=1611254 RepID=A0A2G5TQN3_9PELO|nr:hypothetical protein B9Z55_021132 [Caenorhabditis nigoni]